MSQPTTWMVSSSGHAADWAAALEAMDEDRIAELEADADHIETTAHLSTIELELLCITVTGTGHVGDALEEPLGDGQTDLVVLPIAEALVTAVAGIDPGDDELVRRWQAAVLDFTQAEHVADACDLSALAILVALCSAVGSGRRLYAAVAL